MWLQNRHLINDIDQDILSIKQDEIIKLFGGFRQILKKLLKHHNDLTWIQHDTLSTILYREEKKVNSKQNSPNSSPLSNTSPDSVHSVDSDDASSSQLKLTSLPTNILCYINTFSSLQDMARNQRINILLCSINRMTSSYSNPRHSMRKLSITPYLPQYIEWTLCDKKIETKLKGVKNMKNVLLSNIKVIERSGVIPYILNSIDIKVNNERNKHNKLLSLKKEKNAWCNVINEELQLEIMNFIQLCNNGECIECIMNNGGAEILTSALNKVLIDWDFFDDNSDYTRKMVKHIIIISDQITRRNLKFREKFIKVKYQYPHIPLLSPFSANILFVYLLH